ncbi:Uncharacterised protein [Mycobacteroides abscessus subsp. abscessus]|nr:Uncharacterised protein [Mycobacteroides abscessus subsp. abscessus]
MQSGHGGNPCVEVPPLGVSGTQLTEFGQSRMGAVIRTGVRPLDRGAQFVQVRGGPGVIAEGGELGEKFIDGSLPGSGRP